MSKCKRILTKLLFPHAAWVAILVPLATGLLLYAFLCEAAHPGLTYLAYFLSAYALVVVCARAPAVWRKVRQVKQTNRYLSRYTQDAGLRVKLSLRISLGANLLYALLQLGLGMVNHSVWFYALAVYYAMLAVMRYFLLKETLKNRLGRDRYFEYLIYRLCGVLLVGMNVALSAIVFYIVWQNRGFEHHEIITIAMAAYTFYTLTMAAVNLVRYRKYNSPVMSASKAISLAAALVSLLSLETAMLTAFGSGEDAAFRQVMTACTGSGVCAAVLGIGIAMIVRATGEIKRLKGASHHGE